MLRAIIFNVSWDDFLTKSQLYGKLAKITNVIKERRLRLFAGLSFRKKEELLSDSALSDVTWSKILWKTTKDVPGSDCFRL